MTNRADSDFDAVLGATGGLAAGVSAGSTRHSNEPPEPIGSRIDDWWLRQSVTVQRLLRSAAPAIVVLVAAFTRLFNLGQPNSLVFDETF